MGLKNRTGSSLRRRRSSGRASSLCFFFFFFFFFFYCCVSVFFLSAPSLGIERPCSAPADLCFQEKGMDVVVGEGRSTATTFSARRLLGGPGSSLPRCTGKCGKCTPCKPVHVSVPPGTRMTAEYYPEAWRCKCGNKLYMP